MWINQNDIQQFSGKPFLTYHLIYISHQNFYQLPNHIRVQTNFLHSLLMAHRTIQMFLKNVQYSITRTCHYSINQPSMSSLITLPLHFPFNILYNLLQKKYIIGKIGYPSYTPKQCLLIYVQPYNFYAQALPYNMTSRSS